MGRGAAHLISFPSLSKPFVTHGILLQMFADSLKKQGWSFPEPGWCHQGCSSMWSSSGALGLTAPFVFFWFSADLRPHEDHRFSKSPKWAPELLHQRVAHVFA